jgi:O-antigen/teichoic acid export membrane protein
LRPSRREQLRDPGHARLIFNALLVAGGQGSVVFLFLVYILAARVLGAAAYGDFTLGLTIATIFVALPAWGTGRYASILAAREPERTCAILAGSLGLTLLLALGYFPLVWLTGVLVTPRPAVTWVALLLGVDLLTREYSILLRLLLRVHDAFLGDMISVYVERAFMVFAALFVLLTDPSPVLLAAALAAGRTAGALATTMLFVRRVGTIPVRLESSLLRHRWRAGTPVAFRRAVGQLTFRVDALLLGVMRSASEVGWYGTVYTLMDGVVMLPSIVTGSLGPTLSANFAEGQREVVSRLYQRGLKYLLHVGIFLAAVFAVLADVVVVELYGAEYAPAAAALRILAVSVVFIFVRRHATEVLDNVDLRSATAWIFGAGLLMNVVLNLLLIPRYGYLGAAAATVVSEGYLMGAMLWTLHSSAYVASFLPLLVAPTVAIVPAALLMWRLAGSPFLAVTASAAFYLAALTLLGAWDEKDRLALRSAVAKVRERLAR